MSNSFEETKHPKELETVEFDVSADYLSGQNKENARIETLLSDAEKSELIYGALTFNHLYNILDKIGTVVDEDGVYTPGELKIRIEEVRKGTLDLSFIPGTYGLRDKVESLLKIPNDPDEPSGPPPLDAKVALEIPRAEELTHVEDDGSETPPEIPPDGPPPTLDTSVALNISEQIFQESNTLEPEGNPDDPISPLTEEETQFLYEARTAYERWRREVIEIGRSDSPDPTIDINRPEVKMKYEKLAHKLARFEAITAPRSFNNLAEALKDVDFFDGENILEGSALWEAVEKVRKGELALVTLPESMREGVASLVAQEVYKRLAINTSVEIPDYEWEMFTKARHSGKNYLGFIGGDPKYPRVGDENVKLKDSTIKGTLVWASPRGDNIIIKTKEGYHLASTDDLVVYTIGAGLRWEPITYGEYKDNQQSHSQRSAPRARRL